MTKRLTEKQKKEIVQNFECGSAIGDISQQFNCTKLTVIRNLKKNLGEIRYKELFDKNKSLKTKSVINSKENDNLLDIKIDNKNSNKKYTDLKNSKENITRSEFSLDDSFFEIAPLDYKIDNTSRKELSSVHISEVDFPKIVYMIVNKKIELEIKLLKDYPEWEFLPPNDLNRKTIEIYFDLNIAKRFCSKDQKVIKVPNTSVFNISASILNARGISRIICPDKLIAL